MPFGQYKDWDIKDIPVNYLLWLSEEAEIVGQLKWDVAVELENRFKIRDEEGTAKLSKEDRKRLVIYSTKDIRDWWVFYEKVFSYTFFGIHLMPPAMKIERSRRWMGYWAHPSRVLCINNHYILPQSRFENILIHEMCHQYISDRAIDDTSSHGRRWRNIAAKMSKATGSEITICDEEIYAPNIYFEPDKLVILPELKRKKEKMRSIDEIEASYENFIEELSNM